MGGLPGMLIWDILKQMGGEYMNYEKVGSVIYQLRKESAMTQQELADKLFISNKAISKWERGVSQTKGY